MGGQHALSSTRTYVICYLAVFISIHNVDKSGHTKHFLFLFAHVAAVSFSSPACACVIFLSLFNVVIRPAALSFYSQQAFNDLITRTYYALSTPRMTEDERV